MVQLRKTFAPVVALLVALGTQAQEPQQPPPLRVAVNRVNVGVIVTTESGKPVENLTRADFRIFDDGVEQPITDFLSVDEPAQVVLLIESGPAVLFLGKGHVRAADSFLASLAPEDRVAIVKYSLGPELLLRFTTNKMEAQDSLAGLSFMNGFGQLNLSSSILETLDWLAPLPGKKTIVLLSTGFDSSDPGTWEKVKARLQTSDVRIMAVSLSSNFRQPVKGKKLTKEDRQNREFVKQGFAQADEALREICFATGGRAYFPDKDKEFAQSYNEIAQLVRHEYSLAFAPPVPDGKLHMLKIEAKHADRVESRQAYLAPSPAQ